MAMLDSLKALTNVQSDSLTKKLKEQLRVSAFFNLASKIGSGFKCVYCVAVSVSPATEKF